MGVSTLLITLEYVNAKGCLLIDIILIDVNEVCIEFYIQLAQDVFVFPDCSETLFIDVCHFVITKLQHFKYLVCVCFCDVVIHNEFLSALLCKDLKHLFITITIISLFTFLSINILQFIQKNNIFFCQKTYI